MKFAIISTIIATATAARLVEEPAATPAEGEAVAPEDETEGNIIEAIIQGCPDAIAAVSACYDDSEADIMTCVNCAWEGLTASTDGIPACTDDLDEQMQADYAECSDVCKTECDEQVLSLYACGKPMICSGEVALEIA